MRNVFWGKFLPLRFGAFEDFGAPGPGRREPGQSFSKDVAWAGRMATEKLMDAEPPGKAVATPREIGARPGIMTVNMPGRGMAPRASGCRLCRGDQEGNLGFHGIV
jgi:hypothetical protein